MQGGSPTIEAKRDTGHRRDVQVSTLARRVAIAVAAIVLGLLAVWAAYGPGHVAEGAPWLASAWICIAAGVVLERSMHRPLAGALLVLAGLAWLLPAPGTCLNVEPLTHRCIR